MKSPIIFFLQHIPGDEMKKKVYIIVLNWNNWKDTVECLESVFQNSYPDYQVICVDNGSTDGSEQKIKEWAAGTLSVSSRFFEFTAYNKPVPVVIYDNGIAGKGCDAVIESYHCQRTPLVLIKAGTNSGYAGGNNIGMRYALGKGDASYIWILNNDTVVDKDALAEMVKCAEHNEGVGMTGSKLLYYDKPDVVQSAGGCIIYPWLGNTTFISHAQRDSVHGDEPLEPDYICGASLLVKKDVIETIGLMDENYFLYWEDADWGIRARRNKYTLLYCPESRVWHKEGATSGGLKSMTDYYWTRNGLFFIKKFYPMLLPFVFFAYFVKFTIIRLIRKKPLNLKAFLKGTLDFKRGEMGKHAEICDGKTQ